MKISFAYGVIAFLLLCSCVILIREESPEQLLVGKWQEVSWEIERVNSEDVKNNAESVGWQKQEICGDMIIHDAEIWEFDTKKQLTLTKQDDSVEKLKWNVKGRGHILELKHSDKKIEDFQVHELTKDTLVIYFNFDLQVRGIVKMTFKKVEDNSYAQKIQ